MQERFGFIYQQDPRGAGDDTDGEAKEALDAVALIAQERQRPNGFCILPRGLVDWRRIRVRHTDSVLEVTSNPVEC